MSEAEVKVSSSPALIEIDDMDKFVRILAGWHKQKVAILQHLLSIPDGTTVEVDSGEPLALTGDALKGFQAGLHSALIELGELPFVVELEANAPTDH